MRVVQNLPGKFIVVRDGGEIRPAATSIRHALRKLLSEPDPTNPTIDRSTLCPARPATLVSARQFELLASLRRAQSLRVAS
jgi:hypothetical protein